MAKLKLNLWTVTAITGIILALCGCVYQKLYFTVGERSVAVQLVKYFARPHEGIPTGIVSTGAYWQGSQLAKQEHLWIYPLSNSEVRAIKEDVQAAMALNKPLNRYVSADLPLSFLRHNITLWRKALDPRNRGALGVVIIKGLPVHDWTLEESKLFWWCFGLHLGIPGAQNGQGELVGNIRNEFYTSKLDSSRIGEVRQYRTNEAIGFHCDTADVVGLLCLKSAGLTGGRSRLASSVTVFNLLIQRRADLVPTLFERTPLDTRGDGGVNWIYVTPAAYFQGVLRTFWHTQYFLSVFRHKPVPTGLSRALDELISVYDGIANEPGVFLEIDFEEGDIQLISNHVVI
jgi:hypothetical protein